MNYQDIPAERFSVLKHMDDSPRHYQIAKARPFDPQGATSFYRVGSALHCLVLEPDKYDETFAVYPGKVRRGKEYDAWAAANADKVHLSDREELVADKCADAVLSSDLATSYLGEHRELAVTWADPDTLIPCKGRVDTFVDGLVEIKTTSKPLKQFGRAIFSYNYHAQVAWYTDGLRANGHDLPGNPVIIAVETTEPFGCAVFALPPEVVEAGRRKYKGWLRKLAECEAKDEWPGYGGGELVWVELPPWEQAEYVNSFFEGVA